MGHCQFYSPLLLFVFLSKGCHSQVCGRAPFNPRIVGGADAPPGGWPWMVYLKFTGSDGYLYMCGGSVINQHWILTAAHCLDKMVVNLTRAYLGVHRRSSVGLDVVQKEVAQWEIHNRYNCTGHLDNDIALLKMSSPVTYTNCIQPVCLAQRDSTFHTGVTAWVAGWGLTAELNNGGGVSSVLQEVRLPIVGDNQCKCRNVLIVPKRTICAGYAEGKKDACRGDSGGPLVVKQGTVWVQAGVVSFGEGCARPNRPGVYTEVSEFQDWIESIVETEDPPGFVTFTSPGEDTDKNYTCTDRTAVPLCNTTTTTATTSTNAPTTAATQPQPSKTTTSYTSLPTAAATTTLPASTAITTTTTVSPTSTIATTAIPTTTTTPSPAQTTAVTPTTSITVRPNTAATSTAPASTMSRMAITTTTTSLSNTTTDFSTATTSSSTTPTTTLAKITQYPNAISSMPPTIMSTNTMMPPATTSTAPTMTTTTTATTTTLATYSNATPRVMSTNSTAPSANTSPTSPTTPTTTTTTAKATANVATMTTTTTTTTTASAAYPDTAPPTMPPTVFTTNIKSSATTSSPTTASTTTTATRPITSTTTTASVTTSTATATSSNATTGTVPPTITIIGINTTLILLLYLQHHLLPLLL